MSTSFGFDLKGEFYDALKIISLDRRKMEQIARDVGATRTAVLFIFLSVLSSQVGFLLFYPEKLSGLSVVGLFGAIIMGMFFSVLLIWITSLIAERFFKGEAFYDEFLRVMGYASVVGLITIVPEFSLIAAIIYLIVMYKALRVVYKLKFRDAILTLLILFLVASALLWLLSGFQMSL